MIPSSKPLPPSGIELESKQRNLRGDFISELLKTIDMTRTSDGYREGTYL